jgi:hypothetical protein
MFYKQKGFWPAFTLVAGGLLAIYFLLVILLYIVNFIILAEILPVTPGMIIRVLLSSLLYFIFVFLGYLLMSLFPSVRVTADGIEYKTLFVLRKIAWNEIVNLSEARWPKGTKAVIFIRKRESAFRYLLENSIGLYPNQTHGLLVGVHEPIVAFTKGLQNRDAILKEIQKHVPEQAPEQE